MFLRDYLLVFKTKNGKQTQKVKTEVTQKDSSLNIYYTFEQCVEELLGLVEPIVCGGSRIPFTKAKD